MKQWLINFFKDEDGLTMVEYAVAGGLVTVGAVVAFTQLGGSVSNQITNLNSAVSAG